MKSGQKGETHTNFIIVALLQAVIYTGVWLWNEYVASYLTLIFPGMILVILIIAFIQKRPQGLFAMKGRQVDN